MAEKVGAQIAGAIASSQIFAKHHQVLKAFQESEEKYRILVQNSSEAIFIAQHGVIKFPNLLTQKMLGYSAEELAIFLSRLISIGMTKRRWLSATGKECRG